MNEEQGRSEKSFVADPVKVHGRGRFCEESYPLELRLGPLEMRRGPSEPRLGPIGIRGWV